MQRPSLSNLAIILVVIVIFFSMLTQRMMLSSETSVFEKLIAGREKGAPWKNATTTTTSRYSFNNTFTAVKKELQELAQVDWFTSRPHVDMKDLKEDTSFLPIPVINDSHPTPAVETRSGASLPVKRKQEVVAGNRQTGEEERTEKYSPAPRPQNEKLAGGKMLHDIIDYHPRISPRNGSDISPSQQMALLLCPNQSKCIVPALQLKIKVKVYFCRHPTRQGVRFYFLSKEGFLLHPNVELVAFENINDADFIIYLPGSAPWHLTECYNTSFSKRLIVLDEFDGHTLFEPRPSHEEMVKAYGPLKHWYFMYFKRSFVRRLDGRFMKYPHLDRRDVYPMTYALAEAYLQHKFNFQREIEIVCTLRGSKHMTTRQRVQDWVSEYAKARQLTNVVTGEVNSASRSIVSKSYFQQMYNAQIIVTVNPANWEGDFRLWEAMATGALIMVDPVFVPHQYPLLDGIHVVYFSNTNKTDLIAKLDYYRTHKDEARKIAITGYLHAMKYHRTVNLADYILRTAHYKRSRWRGNTLPDYRYTGQYLNNLTAIQEAEIFEHHKPGAFHHHEHDHLKI